MADWLEAFVPLRIHVLVRFGRWDELIAEPLPDDVDLYCTTAATIHYGRGVAHAAKGQLPQAHAEREAFAAAYARIPDSRAICSTTPPRHPGRSRARCSTAKSPTEKGDSTTRSRTCGAPSNSTTHCRTTSRGAGCSRPGTPTARCCSSRAVSRRPPTVYAADLGLDPTLSRPCQHPGNVWSLHGYHECLQRLGRTAEAAIIGQQLELAEARADVPDPGVLRLPARTAAESAETDSLQPEVDESRVAGDPTQALTAASVDRQQQVRDRRQCTARRRARRRRAPGDDVTGQVEQPAGSDVACAAARWCGPARVARASTGGRRNEKAGSRVRATPSTPSAATSGSSTKSIAQRECGVGAVDRGLVGEPSRVERRPPPSTGHHIVRVGSGVASDAAAS